MCVEKLSAPAAVRTRELRRQWHGVKSKCLPTAEDVFPEWRDSFEAFAKDMTALGWSPGMTIDKVDPDGVLEPRNVQFTTQQHNVRLRSNTKYVQAFGLSAPLCWFIENHPLCTVRDYHVVYGRIKSGWGAELAMTTPTRGRSKPMPNHYSRKSVVSACGRSMKVGEWASQPEAEVSAKDIARRLNLGWPAESAISVAVHGPRPPRA